VPQSAERVGAAKAEFIENSLRDEPKVRWTQGGHDPPANCRTGGGSSIQGRSESRPGAVDLEVAVVLND